MPGRIYVTRPLLREAEDFLRRNATVDINPNDTAISRIELLDSLKTADAAVTLVTDSMDAEVLQSLPHLKIVANVGVGYNNIDVQTATRLGIAVTNTPGVLTETTADFAWALLMAAARRVTEADSYVKEGRFKAWGLGLFIGQDVFGKTLGIVGLGRIGQAVARRARGFGMNILFHNSGAPPAAAAELGAKPVSFETLLKESDFISLHVPLKPETHGLLNDAAFARMKPGAIVINTSRGPVVDEKALARALGQGRIAAAGLDVYEREPDIEPELLTMANVVLAPHIASATRETRLKMYGMAAENAVAGIEGKRPPNLVNPEVWERRRGL